MGRLLLALQAWIPVGYHIISVRIQTMRTAPCLPDQLHPYHLIVREVAIR